MTVTPPESQGRWRPDDLVAEVARTELGDRFDHITPDPENPMRWIVTLKDGTTTPFEINCIRW